MASDHFYHPFEMKPIPTDYNPLPLHPASPTPPPEAPASSGSPQNRQSLSQSLRFLRILSRTTSLLTNTLIFSILAFTLSIFLSTRRSTTSVSSRNLWPAESTTWPTVLLLALSVLTFASELIIFSLYCLRSTRAEAQNSWKLVLATHGVHFAAWVVVTVLYRTEKKLRDLWGWSCSDVAGVIQGDLRGEVDFERLCALQVRRLFLSFPLGGWCGWKLILRFRLLRGRFRSRRRY